MSFAPRIVDFKSLLWWLMVLVQFLGGSYLNQQSYPSGAHPGEEYLSLVFEFNVIFGLLFLLNHLVRQYFIIDDTSYYRINRLNLQVQFQYVIDGICLVVSIIYLVVGSVLLL